MDCVQAVALISARLDHEIQPDDRVLLDSHLRACAACQATVEAFALQHQELRRTFEPRRQAAATVAVKVNAELDAPRPRAAKRTRTRHWGVRAAMVLGAVAACAAVVLLVQWLFQPRWQVAPLPDTTAGGNLKSLSLSLHSFETGELTPRPRPEAPPATKLEVGESIETKAGEKRRLALPDGSVLYVNQNTKVHLDADRQATLTTGAVYLEVAPRNPAADGSTFAVQTPSGPVKAFGTKFEVQADDAKGSAVAVTQGRVTFDEVEVRAGQELTMRSAAEVARTNRIELSAPVPAPRASHELDWTRDLMAAAESPLVPASQYDGGALIAFDPYGQEAKLRLRDYHIDVHVEDGFARTTIDQTYFNNNPWRLEGTFYFPLPPDASLSRLAMYVNGDLMEGGMTERDYGNAVYKKIVRSQRDPALLEWVDGSTFKMRVFPLEGRQEKRIVLSYTQRLSTLYGRTQYRFPAGHSLQVVDHWSFHAAIKNGGALRWSSPTHPTMRAGHDGADLLLDVAENGAKVDRDVEVDMIDPRQPASLGERVRFSSAESDGAGYLMLRFRPELQGRIERQHRDWVFLFESSADRDPLLARAQIDIIRHMLEYVERDDTFSVLAAGTTTHSFTLAPVLATPENVASAVAFLEQTHLIGALDLGRALTDAEPLLRAGQNSYLVHVGSGLTAMGRRQEKLAELLPNGVHYIGVGVGKHWGRSWMKEVAEKTGGYFTQINPDEPIAWRAFDLVSTLNTPRLLHVQVAPGDAADAPRFLTDSGLVAQGEEVCAVAQVARGADGSLKLPRSVVVTGVIDGLPYRRELPVRDVAPHTDYLPRTWAKWEIDRLLSENANENKSRIVELSKAMYVMTPFTSLLVLENEEMYKEFKVDRGRKDHWAMYPCPPKIPIVFEPDPTQPIDVRNAPKTPKPVANLVRPTVVTRAAPSFLNDNSSRVASSKTPSGRRLHQTGRSSEPQSTGKRLDDFVALNNEGLPQVFFERPLSQESQVQDRRLGRTQDWSEGHGNGRVVSLPSGQTSRESDKRFGFSKGRVNLNTLSSMDFDRPASNELSLGMDMKGDLPELGFNGGTVVMGGLKKRVGGERRVYPVADLAVDVTANTGWLSDHYRRHIEQGWTPTLLYQAPSYTGDARLFSDLVSYAPGLNTTEADIQTVLEAEAAPNLANAPGHIDPDARRLIEQSRRPRWRTLSVGGDNNEPSLQLDFDGAGRYVYEYTLPLGLRERVVCDGVTLWHLYPELGLAARRTVSRFHRAEVAGLTPWALPPAEDIARGVNVEFVDAHTITLIPLGAKMGKTIGDKPASYYRLKLVFAPDGRLAERRLEEAPADKTVRREIYDGNGGVRVLDPDGKEISNSHRKIADVQAPDLATNTANLVVLQMPLRSRARVYEDVGLDGARPLADGMNSCYPYLESADAIELLVGAMTEGNAEEARQIFRTCFEARSDLRPGLFTLLSAAGVNVFAEPGFQQYLNGHQSAPLAHYFAILGNPAYNYLQSIIPLDVGAKVGPEDSLLGRLATFHDLQARWQSGPWPLLDSTLRRADEKRTFDFIRRNHDNILGWALQIHVQNHASNNKRLLLALAETWGVLGGDGERTYTAQYEQARRLLHAGKHEQAHKLFMDLHAWAMNTGVLPAIEGDFRAALQQNGADDWMDLMVKAMFSCLAKKDGPAAVMLAWQCRQVGDAPLSDNLLIFILDATPKDADGLRTTLAAIEYLWQTDQLPAADDLLSRVLADESNSQNAKLWRLAAELAERGQQQDRATACLEKALDIEYRQLPQVIDLQSWRTDYGKLLSYYQAQAKASAGLHAAPPVDLAARTIRAADRWRSHDPEADNACKTAAAILHTLGDGDKAWEYLTTPVALHPAAASWEGMAQSLSREGRFDMADRAYAAACEHDPDNALLLWQRAQNLRGTSRAAESLPLLRQLAEGEWPKSYQWIRAQARWQLDRQ
jgi:ferric-dicitrate binding protein FerR (iron transport regulator)